MSTPPAISVGHFLDQVRNSTLKSLLSQARRQAGLEAQVRELLPAVLAPHVRVGGFRDKRLILLVDSQEWVLPARMSADLLRGELARRHRFRVEAIEVRVAPELARGDARHAPRRRPRPPGLAAAESLATAARSIGDPRLAEALMRLAAKVQQTQPDD